MAGSFHRIRICSFCVSYGRIILFQSFVIRSLCTSENFFRVLKFFSEIAGLRFSSFVLEPILHKQHSSDSCCNFSSSNFRCFVTLGPSNKCNSTWPFFIRNKLRSTISRRNWRTTVSFLLFSQLSYDSRWILFVVYHSDKLLSRKETILFLLPSLRCIILNYVEQITNRWITVHPPSFIHCFIRFWRSISNYEQSLESLLAVF